MSRKYVKGNRKFQDLKVLVYKLQSRSLRAGKPEGAKSTKNGQLWLPE